MFQFPTTPKIKPVVSIGGVGIDIENTPEGSITLEQYRNVRANSPGFDILYTKLTNEALIAAVKHNLVNCSPRPSVIYEGALQNILVPELLKRLERPKYSYLKSYLTHQCIGCGIHISLPLFRHIIDGLKCPKCGDSLAPLPITAIAKDDVNPHPGLIDELHEYRRKP